MPPGLRPNRCQECGVNLDGHQGYARSSVLLCGLRQPLPDHAVHEVRKWVCTAICSAE